MEEFKQIGKVKSIRMSKYYRHHLETILETATEKRVVNQIDFQGWILEISCRLSSNYA